MASRTRDYSPPPPRGDKYRRDSPPAREAGRERERARSRSPRRYEDRDRPERAERSDRRGGDRDGYYDRERTEYRRENPNSEPGQRPYRRDYDAAPSRDAGRSSSGRGGGSYDSGRGGYDYGRSGGGGGYRGGGRYDDRERERDRPLDRRAIEEGRRQREAERARGITFAPDGSKIVPREEEESVEPTPAPEGDGEVDEEAAAMAAMMGFGGFGTTKGKEVEGNDEGVANIHKKRTWRQYMNRRGGFNRALEKMK